MTESFFYCRYRTLKPFSSSDQRWFLLLLLYETDLVCLEPLLFLLSFGSKIFILLT
tara:strand:- start:4258 stop:4425 length:168 start_codon:yes stop_codon:yes gene_type:complete